MNEKKFEIDMTPNWEGVYRWLKHIEKWDEFKNDNLSRMLFKTLCFGQVNPSNYSVRPYRYIWTESDA